MLCHPADVQRVSGAVGPTLDPVQAVVHVPGDDPDAVLPADSQLPADSLRVNVPQADDLVVSLSAVSHLVIVGGEQGDGVDPVEVFRHRLDDHRALVRIGAPGKLVQQEQGVALLHLCKGCLELYDRRAEDGKA